MQLTRKRIKKINAVYSLEGTVLENVDNIKYLGVTISKDLKWNTHVSETNLVAFRAVLIYCTAQRNLNLDRAACSKKKKY